MLLTAASRRQNCAVGVDVGGDRNSSKQHRGPAPDIMQLIGCHTLSGPVKWRRGECYYDFYPILVKYKY